MVGRRSVLGASVSVIGIAVLTVGLAISAQAALAKPAITLVAPSPAAGAVLTGGGVSFAFTYNRTPKQTKSLTCTLAGPTASSGPCTAPSAASGGSSSGKSYSGLANGSYTFTVALRLGDGGSASVSRQFTVSAVNCISSLGASVPSQSGAKPVSQVYGIPWPGYWWWPVPAGIDSVISRADDVEVDANLTGGCADASAWTYAWSYALGDVTAQPVPSNWTGATGAALTIPKWTLQFVDLTHEDYTFTVVATPPASSTQSPLTANLVLRVGSFNAPSPGFSPYGFTQPISPGQYTYSALGLTPHSSSVDWPADQQDQLGYFWHAEFLGGDEIAPDSGQGTPYVQYTWPPSDRFLLRLTVCAANAENSPTNPCTAYPDFVLSTFAG